MVRSSRGFPRRDRNRKRNRKRNWDGVTNTRENSDFGLLELGIEMQVLLMSLVILIDGDYQVLTAGEFL
ncbi:hypothetical protein TURU_129060 [Turdus rufiventris]|nr:hypothetical protein TURU_129060 [Turdus rufiventris]